MNSAKYYDKQILIINFFFKINLISIKLIIFFFTKNIMKLLIISNSLACFDIYIFINKIK